MVSSIWISLFSEKANFFTFRLADTIERPRLSTQMVDYFKLNMLSNISIKMLLSLEFLQGMVSSLNQLLISLLSAFLKKILTNWIGVVLAAEKKEASKLFVPTRESGKLYKMDEHVLVSVSGVVADANFLIDYGRL